MLESIQFKNFKALRDTTLPLQPLTLIVGPNGSGKSTALQALRGLSTSGDIAFHRFVSITKASATEIVLNVYWGGTHSGEETTAQWVADGAINFTHRTPRGLQSLTGRDAISRILKGIRVYALDPVYLAMPHPLMPNAEMKENGAVMAVVLDRLRDQAPERFEALNQQLTLWLPEFDRVLFETPSEGQRAIRLRVKGTQNSFLATELSQGTLLALAILTIAHLPDPPSVMGLEEPDRGIHPRLLRDVKDALERLAYPDRFGESRKPVQVIATTHSPYFLDLFRDEPECVVIAEKQGSEATFRKLIDIPNYEEILQDSHLGDAWYSGILGGVPAER